MPKRRRDPSTGWQRDDQGVRAMQYVEEIRSGHSDPSLLESLFQAAQQENRVPDFAAALASCRQEAPHNLLYGAWHHRLQQAAEQPEVTNVNWKLAVPLAVVAGLSLWVLSLPELDLNFADGMPYVAQVWAPLVGVFIIGFLTLTAKSHLHRAVAVLIGLLAFGAYAMLFSILPNDRNYQTLAAVHVPLLAWIGVGIVVLGQGSDHRDRFGFLIKSIEVLVRCGIYAAGGGVFVALTYALFQSIDVRIPPSVERLLFPGGIGVILLLATASTYDPHLKPLAQNFRSGLSKVVSTLMRLLLPLTLLVLLIFSFFILQPDNFWIPFNNRDALITYNAVLFAVVFLILGAVPVGARDLPRRIQSILRKGAVAVATLTVLVSLYAMSATLYRTYLGTITMNRMAVIGWNTINIGILVLLVYRILRSGPDGWVYAAQSAFGSGMNAYVVWSVFVVLSVPFIFGHGLAMGWSRPAQPASVPVATPDTPATTVPDATPAVSQAANPTARSQVVPTATPGSLSQLPAGCPPACSSAGLAGAYLPEVDWREADVSGADLRGADLQGADLRGANLRGADLRGADLRSARLEGASLQASRIDRATRLDDKWRWTWQLLNQSVQGRDLSAQRLDLSRADLSGADLRGVRLAFSSLAEANLSGADLRGADLNNVSLHGVLLDENTQLDAKWRLVWDILEHGGAGRDLAGADLSQADLSQADLGQADLRRAVLTETNLSGASLYGADLRGAVLSAPDPHSGPPHVAVLEQADLAGVKLDETTQIEEKWRRVWQVVNYGARGGDLSGTGLSGADLHEIDLSGASLVGARLDGANLREADLRGADLNGATLRGADLTEARLAEANFYEAQLSGARLPADLAGANLRKANLNGADLWGYNLSGLNLSRAELRGANLAQADLHQADLSEAHLEGAYLWLADLSGANLRGVYLDDAYLWGASLDGVDLTGAEISRTVMPDGTLRE
jgi:uncharacterized protein YjbI with pentapeptide repeats